MSKVKVLVVDDEKDYRNTYKMLLESRNYKVETASSAKEALEKMHNEYFPLILSDVIMPETDGIDFLIKAKEEISEPFEIILVTGYGNIQTAITAIKNGAFGFFIKSHNPEELLIEIEKARKSVEMKNKLSMYKLYNDEKNFLLESKNSKMKSTIELAKKVSCSNSNIFITGESGVGKEVIAKFIHDNSDRANMPFVAINCQSFSDNIIESELFGHEKGSFTGAIERRIGRFEEANGGTLFLDEIGELSQNTQVKLLRVLENHMVERIGSNNNISVDFRLISATNKNIKPSTKCDFREDLYYRINTIEVNIPPLRERKEDLEDLIYFFLNRFNKSTKKNISQIDLSTMTFLKNYDYPGNIRELKNIIERLVVTSNGKILDMNSFTNMYSDYISKNNSRNKINEIEKLIFNENGIFTFQEAKRNFEYIYFKILMDEFDGNITKAATHINLSRRQLFNKLTEFNLKQ